MRVTAWATPLPLDKGPFQPAPEGVLQLLFGDTGGVRALAQPIAPSSNVYWLPLGNEVGLAYVAEAVFVVTPAGAERQVAEGYRLSEFPYLSVAPRAPVTRLELGALTLTVRTKVARAAVQLLGLAELSRTGTRVEHPASSWHVPENAWTTALLSAHTQPTDTVLAFIPLPLSLPVSSRWLGELRVPAYLLVTQQRIALIGAALTGELFLPSVATGSSVGASVELKGETVQPTSFRGLEKGECQLNEHRFKGPKTLLTIARCFEKHQNERVLVAAQSLCKTAQSEADRRVALGWLRQLHTTSAGPASRVPQWCLAHQLGQLNQGRAPWLDDSNVPDLVEVWHAYAFDLDVGHWLLGELRDASSSWRLAAVKLSEELWRRHIERAIGPFEAARFNLTHAEYAAYVGFPERARSVLTDTPQLCPPPTLGDINLPAFSGASPWRDVRRDIELLMRNVTAADPRQQDLARQRLIALDPLNVEWLQEATRSGVLGQRAQIALQLLVGPLVNDSTQEPVPRSHLRPLEAERIGAQLSHPLTRAKHTITSKLADAIAIVSVPDEGVLKLYCERVTKADSPLLDAMDRAATVLGLGHFELYVSRGKDDVGAQAFAAHSKLLLIGGQHTDPNSRHYLEPRELTFAFATELAHIRFGHTRVSGTDVIRGLLSKGKQGAELAFNLLPLISGINLGKRLGVVTAKLSLPQINKALTAARTLESAVNTALPSERHHTDLSRPTETLLDAHRLEQLSADRAGLTCCGDLTSAFKAMLKTRTDYVRVNSTLATNGALTAIEQQAPSNAVAFDDLRLRLGNLIAFYMSDDYEELRRLTHR